ncbi:MULTISPECIES: PDDEXK nuclease domain-containing protein [unclassified Pseudoalteromonas]|uniref:PDDEXK nuclease domain-containing protein n=1 Tax=unclassified Pseudoalteromonas TaxID=194690 RepID=UPI0025B435E1|nr:MULTISPECIES: PDDEXK nuclease domain-containing protein [unclassified Pseudoalteromonas]MDN3380479.1 PDDEXK nuclease domain-containing protein [Pseudoalteromonas sp. APC 3893]MDN3388861.1 PDDEXK nuclease domain-containing protein [Pseudoalteromonas sp. APC 4017]
MSKVTLDQDYKNWVLELKRQFRQSQLKAVVKVNSELLQFYWHLGSNIVQRQHMTNWGEGFLTQLSQDLMAEFPDVKGFSRRNLELIRQWYSYWSQNEVIAQQAVAQIITIPWGHNQVIINKCANLEEALYYVKGVNVHGWSRAVLTHQIESGLYQREGKAVNNFEHTLPPMQSDLAQQSLKDPYVFDFLTLTTEYSERDLEQSLVKHVTHFLMELGAGFAYMGKQVPIKVGKRDFYLDLLFYHTRLHCHVVIELKITDFEPEHAGKLNFYIKAVDEQLRGPNDEPTIGILLCKNKDSLVAEYALSDINKPIGVSEYQLTQSLPDNLKPNLPSIEEIEAELLQDFINDKNKIQH